jgi:predicted alpha/beta hydrolase
MKNLSITTTDGVVISATEFTPDQANGKVILMNAATGVQQYFYFNYAQFLANKGYTVYTYDYRGIGKSVVGNLKDSKANYSDWGSVDFSSMFLHLKNAHSDKKYYLIGHSFGGNCLGMSAYAHEFEKIVTVSSQNGYWRYFPSSKQGLILFISKLSMPILSRIMGYYPSKIKGLGESLPKGVGLDWAKVLTHPLSVESLVSGTTNFYKKIKSDMLMISIEDDWMASRLAVDKLAEAFSSANIKRRHISLSETGNKSIGHLNFFRKSFQENLWEIPVDWLEKA